MTEAFYVADGDGFAATELTRGPWDPGFQHAGPPAALLGRAVERHEARAGAQVIRITFDILRAIPIASFTVAVRMVRPGRSLELLEAVLSDERGEVMRATAWRCRTTSLDLPGAPADPPPPGPETGVAAPFFDTGVDAGYHTAMEWSFVAGAFRELGPSTVWMRMRVPLLAGEEPSPLTRVLAAADSGNGVSAALDYGRFVFINADLSVHLLRPPDGEWVCLDAITRPQPSGIGLTDTALFDERGPIGRAAQSLLVDERGG